MQPSFKGVGIDALSRTPKECLQEESTIRNAEGYKALHIIALNNWKTASGIFLITKLSKHQR